MVLSDKLRDAAYVGINAAIEEWFSTGTRDPNERDAIGRTLLYYAAQNGRMETIRILLANGACVDAPNSGGFTPLHGTAFRGYHAAAGLLLDHGARVDGRTTLGRTPLYWAAYKGNRDTIRFLLNRGAELEARDDDDYTAEAVARNNNEQGTADLLKEIRLAGGWRSYVLYPRFRLLVLRILAEHGRAETQDPLFRRLFPAGPPAPEGTKRPREAHRAQKGGRLPRGIFMHIFGYWRSSRAC